LTEYLQAAQIEPDNPAWQASLGDAYTQSGDLVSALAAYQKATQLAPNDATYWRLLAMFCSDNDLYVLDIGLPAAKQVAQLAPNDPQTLDVLGWSYSNAGLLYNAEQNLLHAIKLSPKLAIVHLHLAENYLRQGNNTLAFTELNLVVQLDQRGASGQMAEQILKQYFP
jgi:Flp pilus assembly protein TadD